MLTFPPELIKEPVIFSLGHKFNVVPSIRRAEVTDDRGWVVLELSGEDENIDQAIDWAVSQGVRVDPVGGDILQG
jgi:hypothetical protein